jgi:ATP-binding cassette, subfamily B, bacterial
VSPPKKPSDYELLKDAWIWRNVAPYRAYLAQISAIILLAISINFVIPLLSRSVVNEGILAGDNGYVNLMIVLQAGLYGGLILLNTLRTKISFQVSSRLVTRVTSEYFRHVVSLPMAYFRTSSSGKIVEHVRDLERVQRFAAVELVDATASAVSIISLSLLLLWINSVICLIFVSSAALYLFWITTIGRKRRQVDNERFRENSRSREIEIGIVDAIQDIKIAGHEERSLATWASVQLSNLETRLRAARIEQLQVSGGHLFTRIGMVLVTYVSARKAISGEITLGDFTITSVLTVQLYFNVNQLLDFFNKLDDVRSALRRVHAVRHVAPESAPVRGQALSPVIFPIILDEVTFTYPGALRPSLNSISFAAESGSMTALIGPSGSGKSSILKLLLRLEEPDGGQIMVAGRPLTSIDHVDWRNRIGAVMQDGCLFAASLRDNIVAGRELDTQWLACVIEAACVGDVIEDSAHGLDTKIGPGGAKLSVGQIQRLLIARALYKRPSLLLLDEATSALDQKNENSIIASIRNLMPDVTSIVAAHRLNTIMHSDRVLLIDHGRIIDSGTPDTLLRTNAGRLGISQGQLL